MRITAEHLDVLATAVKAFDTPTTRQRYRDRDFPRAHLVRDLDKRYRWDLFYAAKVYNLVPCEDYTDAHFDTALRKIVQPLG
jgi:hypothetical protein